jgi:hypothetical protein
MHPSQLRSPSGYTRSISRPRKYILRKFAALLAFLLLSTTASLAQLGVYAGFTTSTLTTVNTPRMNGGTFGAYFDGSHHPLLNFGVDLRGVVLPSNTSPSVTSITAGPRVILHLPVIPIHPYGEVLIGGAHVRDGQGVAYTDTSGFASSADLHILPYIDWRILDYSYTRLNSAHASQNSFTTGLVVRIPFS